MSSTLDVKIQGREYRVACAPEEVDALQAAADLLNARMGDPAFARATLRQYAGWPRSRPSSSAAFICPKTASMRPPGRSLMHP